jgi:Prokaryotic cytochrome b561
MGRYPHRGRESEMRSRHARWVRLTHWMATVSVAALAFSGVEILMVHPRLYWGEAGNDLTPPLLEQPISRNYRHGGWTVPTPLLDRPGAPVSAGRTFEIFNENGWGRSHHTVQTKPFGSGQLQRTPPVPWT